MSKSACDPVLRALEDQRQALQLSLQDFLRQLETVQNTRLEYLRKYDNRPPEDLIEDIDRDSGTIILQDHMEDTAKAVDSVDTRPEVELLPPDPWAVPAHPEVHALPELDLKGAEKGTTSAGIETLLISEKDAKETNSNTGTESRRTAPETKQVQAWDEKRKDKQTGFKRVSTRPLEAVHKSFDVGTQRTATHMMEHMLGFEPDQHAVYLESLKGSRFWKLTRSSQWSLLASFMIICNAAFIGAEAQVNFRAARTNIVTSEWWTILDVVFVTWFTFEILCRLCAEKWTFFWGSETRINLLDSILVVISLASGLASTSSYASRAPTIRLLRLLRIVRIIRVVRVMREFRALRLLAYSIMESMGALLWCALIVCVPVYLFAIFFIDGATEYVAQEVQDPETAEQLDELFGSVLEAMLCLFMTVSGGIDWFEVLKPLQAIHWAYKSTFVLYAFIMLFGILNVVVATFVEQTAQVSRKDKEYMVFSEMKRVTEYAELIKRFFHEADTDRSGMLSWEEFECHMNDRRVKAFFQSLDLDVSQAHVLFELLNSDSSDGVHIDEFVGGCMKLKGNARSLDVHMLLQKVERILERLDANNPGATLTRPRRPSITSSKGRGGFAF